MENKESGQVVVGSPKHNYTLVRDRRGAFQMVSVNEGVFQLLKLMVSRNNMHVSDIIEEAVVVYWMNRGYSNRELEYYVPSPVTLSLTDGDRKHLLDRYSPKKEVEE